MKKIEGKISSNWFTELYLKTQKIILFDKNWKKEKIEIIPDKKWYIIKYKNLERYVTKKDLKMK